MNCWDCGQPLGRVRLVVSGRLMCSDCLYTLEHGESERGETPSGRHPKQDLYPQAEHLFSLPPPGARAR